MSVRPELLRLCRLVHESLLRFSDLASDSLTEEIEKDLLIALSQVFRQVKQLTNEFDSDEPELSAEPVDETASSSDVTVHLDNRHCLAKITGNLMFLLAVNSQIAQQLAGNTLVAISEFLITSDGDWDDFIQLLCLSLEFAFCNSLGPSSEPCALDTRFLDCDPSTSRSLKLKLKSANWSAVAAIFRVLRNIQKYLKQEVDDKIVKAYLDSISSLMLNLPWDFLREIYVGCNTEVLKGSTEDGLQQMEVIQPRELTMFFGNFVQFLCSLVTQSSFLEDGDGFSPLICGIINLVPKLAAWCHSDLQSPCHVRISHYFRHKVLMLMVKLSSRTHIEQSISVTWMHLIHKYFEDLLLQPISGGKLNQDGFLEGSPFCTSISVPGKQNMSSRHLQRLTNLLFLKCSLNLVSMRSTPDEPQSSYKNLKHCFSADLNLDSEYCRNSIGLTELLEWLQSHVPADILLNDGLYFERCLRFTLSFLQLFMHEDDILFEMLLQLFHVPFYLERQKEKALAEVKNNLVFLASDLFNPIHLFHLFLAEIHYDHQVLLDYLISKDTGSSCAEYLLRSLRIVCDSWSLFVEFPGVQEDLDQLRAKRRKVLADCTDFKGELYPASSEDGGISSLEEEHKDGHAHGSKTCRSYRRPFVAARDCLVSLTTSINSLNQKNLFPYNPKVLLRRSSALSNKLLELQCGGLESTNVDEISVHCLEKFSW